MLVSADCNDVKSALDTHQNKMAVLERIAETDRNFTEDKYLRNPDPHQHQVENFFKPLEPHWGLIKDVLLWKKPVYSLLGFVFVNGTFCYFASGNFRLFLVSSIVVGLGLCVEDIRSKAAVLLERAGITPEERESYEASLVYQRFCYKVSLIWGFLELHVTKLQQLKEQSHQKYCTVLVIIIVAGAFAYQYIPWIELFYCTFVFLYLWPPAKYHGTHRVIIGVVEPFFQPFITHWKHSRTKRQRDQILKAQKGVVDEEVDSEEEFTKEFNPEVPIRNENAHYAQPPKEEFQQSVPTTIHSSSSKMLINLTEEYIQPSPDHDDSSSTSSQDVMRLDLPECQSSTASDLETPGSSSVSLNSSTSFLPDSQEMPTLSMTTDHWEFEDEDFTQGLEFPDIEDKDYHSSNESLNAIEKKTVKKQSLSKKVNKRGHESKGTSSKEQEDGSDFELLDKSEIDDMEQTLERPSSSGSLGTMGKWLGL